MISSTLYLICLTIMAIALGLGVPYVSLYYMIYSNLSGWIAVPLSVLGILVAAAICIVGLGIMEDLPFSTSSSARERVLVERINAYRARQRAMLEELDEISSILKEILKVLKTSTGGYYEEQQAKA